MTPVVTVTEDAGGALGAASTTADVTEVEGMNMSYGTLAHLAGLGLARGMVPPGPRCRCTPAPMPMRCMSSRAGAICCCRRPRPTRSLNSPSPPAHSSPSRPARAMAGALHPARRWSGSGSRSRRLSRSQPAAVHDHRLIGDRPGAVGTQGRRATSAISSGSVKRFRHWRSITCRCSSGVSHFSTCRRCARSPAPGS